jgi:predicted porin
MDRTRNMFLNLRGGFGGVTIGTYLNPLDAVRGFSAATYSAPGGDFLANHIGAAGLAVTDTKLGTDLTAAGIVGGVSTARALAQNGLSGRSTNSIGYSSPSFDGFTFGLGLSQEKVSTGPVLNEANGFIGSVAYAKGPLSARLAYGEGESEVRTSSTANNTNSAKSTDTSFAVSYNLGVAVPYLQYEATKVDVNQIGGTAFNKEFASNATEIGSTFPMGAFTPYVTFGAGELEYAGSSIKTSAYQLGTTYALSKRTYVYGGAGRFKVDTVAETTGYKLGLVHSF